MSREQHLTERGLTFACTDIGNSERFIAMHGTALRFIPEERRGRQWLAYDGTRWCPEGANPMKRAKETAKAIWDEAKNAPSHAQGELGTWARKSEFEHRLRPMLSLASANMGVSITAFDTEPTKLNCMNGIVDLKTGELIEHSPDQLVTKRANACYYPNGAPCPTWTTFIEQIFLGDYDLIEYVKRALGYSLAGLTTEHALFIAYGLGANGKTTLFETILDIVGDYGTTTEFATFLNTDKRDVRIQEAIGKLKGTRFAIASETDNSRKWNEALVKKLTGGDTLTGAKLHGDAYEFKPTHKLWFQANHLPGFKDASHGFLRRVRVVPFRAKFTGKSIDPYLRMKLLAEREGILAWLVEGARAYFKSGLGDQPSAVRDATEEYIGDNDVLGRFIAECTERQHQSRSGSQETYRAYSTWCFGQNETPQDEKFFGRAMEERGITKKRTNTGVVFENMRLKSPANDNAAVEFNPRVDSIQLRPKHTW